MSATVETDVDQVIAVATDYVTSFYARTGTRTPALRRRSTGPPDRVAG